MKWHEKYVKPILSVHRTTCQHYSTFCGTCTVRRSLDRNLCNYVTCTTSGENGVVSLRTIERRNTPRYLIKLKLHLFHLFRIVADCLWIVYDWLCTRNPQQSTVNRNKLSLSFTPNKHGVAQSRRTTRSKGLIWYRSKRSDVLWPYAVVTVGLTESNCNSLEWWLLCKSVVSNVQLPRVPVNSCMRLSKVSQ